MLLSNFDMQAEIRHGELKKLGLDAKIVLIGKKGITYFNRRQKEYNIAGKSKRISIITTRRNATASIISCA